jgi:hypothetical protein
MLLVKSYMFLKRRPLSAIFWEAFTFLSMFWWNSSGVVAVGGKEGVNLLAKWELYNQNSSDPSETGEIHFENSPFSV